MKQKQKNPFNMVSQPAIRRSGFRLPHEYKTTHDPFQLIPISCFEVLPGDVIKLNVSAVLRFQPLLAPILHRLKMRFEAFEVPYRILDENWPQFITRNPDGDTVLTLPRFDPGDYGTPANVYAQGTLWDYLGYPLIRPPSEACPLDYPRRAYYRIWNEFYRDENLETEIDYEDPASNAYNILNAAWNRDMYTAALPFRQKGTSPALPIIGDTAAVFSMPYQVANTNDDYAPVMSNSPNPRGLDGGRPNLPTARWQVPGNSGFADAFNLMLSENNVVSGATLTGADIADLRYNWQIQAWMERNAVGGTRYTEYLRAQFGTAPLDAILQRPRFIGGLTSDVLISEVLQTSASDNEPTPQGNLAGHGLGLARGNLGSVKVREFGLIMILAHVEPDTAYSQGIDRAWLRRTSFDFPHPIFANLSEQEVFNAEIYTRDNTADPDGSINFTPFGYQARFNELRYLPSKVTNQMRETFDYWHMARKFAAAPALNAAFIRPTAAEITEIKRVFAVPSEPAFVVNYGIMVDAWRPIPMMGVPANLGGI